MNTTIPPYCDSGPCLNMLVNINSVGWIIQEIPSSLVPSVLRICFWISQIPSLAYVEPPEIQMHWLTWNKKFPPHTLATYNESMSDIET